MLKMTLIFFLALAIIPNVLAATEFGYNNLDKPTLTQSVINYTTVQTNSSDYWDSFDDASSYLANHPHQDVTTTGTPTFGDTTINGLIGGYNAPGGTSTYLIGQTTDDGFILLRKGGNTKIQLWADGVSYFNGGNVGINTTAPSHPLTVYGKVNVTGNSNIDVDGTYPVVIQDGVNVYSQNRADRAVLSVSGNNGYMQLKQDSGNAIRTKFLAGSVGYTMDNFAINTTTAVHPLTVRGSANITDNVTIGGNVGIGTSNPTNLLEISQSNDGNDVTILLENSATTSADETATLMFKQGASKKAGKIVSKRENIYSAVLATQDSGLDFYTALNGVDTVRMSILSNGNINTTGNILMGDNGVVQTATPITLGMGGTFSNTAGGNLKLRLFDNGAGNVYGMGVSSAQLDIASGTNAGIGLWTNGGKRMSISSLGDFTFGSGDAGKDYTFTFDGQSSDGVLTWLEDEKQFYFDSGIRLKNSVNNEKQFLLENTGVGYTQPTQVMRMIDDFRGGGIFFDTNETSQQQTYFVGKAYGSDNFQIGYYGDAFDDIAGTANNPSALAQAKITLNTAGNVGIGTTAPSHKFNVKGDANITGNFTGNQYYGELWGHDIGIVDIASANVYYNLTNMTIGNHNGFTASSESLIPDVAGIYKTDISWSFSGTASNEYHISLGINGLQQDKCHAERVIGTGADVGNAGMTCLIRLNAGDVVKPMIENMDSAGNPTTHDINFNMVRIGD